MTELWAFAAPLVGQAEEGTFSSSTAMLAMDEEVEEKDDLEEEDLDDEEGEDWDEDDEDEDDEEDWDWSEDDEDENGLPRKRRWD